MKQLYKILPVVLTVGLIGCNNPTAQDRTAVNSATDNKDSFISKLPDTAPTIKVATTGTMPPFSFQDDYGNMQGIDIDSIRAIGEEQGFKVEFYKETWQNMFDSVESGSRDLAIASISYKAERAEKYSLSDSYFYNPAVMMYVKSNASFNRLEDLKGLRVGVIEGTKQVEQIKEAGGYSELIITTTPFLSYENLIQNKVDVILDDSPVVQYLAKNHPDYDVTIVPYESEDNPAAQQVILMAKDNIKLLNTVNEGIGKLKERRVFKEIEQKWLGGTAPTINSTATNQQTN